MSKDKKPCSSCSKNVDLPSNASVEDVIKIFKDKAQTVQPRMGQLFESNGKKYKTNTILKITPTTVDKKTSTVIDVLFILSKFDHKTKTYIQNNWFTSTQTSTINDPELLQNFFTNPTKYIDLRQVMSIIGKLIKQNKNVKSQSQSKSASCCEETSNNYCTTGNINTYNYPQSDGTTNYECKCKGGFWTKSGNQIDCYNKNGGNCKTINCDNVEGVTYTGSSA